MATALSQYLNNIRDNLRLDPSSENEVIYELQSHIEDRLQELGDAGFSEEEAAEHCMGLLGSAKLVACQIYEAHSQGTWKQALLASIPHLLFGSLFALNWWRGIGWLSIVLILVISIAMYGWSHGKPAWLFSWLGNSLLPVVIAGLFLLYLPKGWAWLSLLIYVPLALWLLYSITIQTIKRDWLFASLTLLPVPVGVGWFLAIAARDKFPEYNVEHLLEFAPWIGLSFLTLAVTVAAFIRLRQRRLKTALLITTSISTLTMVAYSANGGLELSTFLVLVLIVLSLFLIPALLEHRLRHHNQRTAM